MRKNEKGITLIALIITVIVLIILAAISISAIGGNGIVGKAKKAKSNTESSGKKEESGIDDLYNEIELGESGYIEGEDTREEFYVGEKVENPKNKINNYPTYLANIEETQRLINLINNENAKINNLATFKNRLEHTVSNGGSAGSLTTTLYDGEEITVILTPEGIQEALNILEEKAEIIINNFEYNGHKILKNGAIAHVVYGDYGQRELKLNFRRNSLEIACMSASGATIFSAGGYEKTQLEIAKYFVSGVCEILEQENNYSKEEVEIMIGKKGTETIKKYLETHVLSPILGDNSISGGKQFQFGPYVGDTSVENLSIDEETSKKYAQMTDSEFDEAVEKYFENLISQASTLEEREQLKDQRQGWKNSHRNFTDAKETIKVVEKELDRIAKEAHYYQTEKKMINGSYGKNIPSLTIKDLGLTGEETVFPLSEHTASITRVRNAIAILDETLDKFNSLP